MKYIRKTAFLLLAILALLPVTALAAEEAVTPGVTPEATQEAGATATPEPTLEPTATPQITNDALISITPDSVFYPLKLMIESIRISLTLDEGNKAQLMVQYANRRILEAQIMNEQDDQELAQKLIEDSIKLLNQANVSVQNAAGDGGEGYGAVLSEMTRTQEEVMMTISLALQGQEDTIRLMEKVEQEVVSTIATQAFLTSKDNFFDAKDAFMQAKDAYKEAKESGDPDAIAAAYAALTDAEADKDEMEEAKDGYEQVKEQIKESYGDGDKDNGAWVEDEDKDDGDGDEDDDGEGEINKEQNNGTGQDKEKNKENNGNNDKAKNNNK